MRFQGLLALGVVAIVITACGGGGGGGTTTPNITGVSGGSATSTPGVVSATSSPVVGTASSAHMTVKVPNGTGSTSARRVQNIASGSQSISMQLIKAGGVPVTGALQTFPLTASSPGCATVSAGITCTLTVNAPIGDDVFTAQTFASTNGTGALLSSGAIRVTIAANATNAATLSLDGTVASIVVAAASSYIGTPTSGTPVASTRLFIIALDNQGSTILNPTVYNTPIVLQQSFIFGSNPSATLAVQSATNGATTSTSTNYGTITVNSPSDVITLTPITPVTNGSTYDLVAGYIGTAPPAPSPSAAPTALPSSVPQLTIDVYGPPAALSFSKNPWQISGLQFDYGTLNGGSGTRSVSAPSCAGIVSLSIQSNFYLEASPMSVGSCTATVTDTGGSSLTVPITVTTTTVNGS